MAVKTSQQIALIQAQSFRPVFVQTIAFTTSAAVTGITNLTADGGPSGTPVLLTGQRGADMPLLILQADSDVAVRLIGEGTTASSGTVTYTAPSGAQTIVLQGITLSFTAGATATLTALAALAAFYADPQAPLLFRASVSAGVITFKSFRKGKFDALTLAATGSGASASGANLTGGASAAAATSATNAIVVKAGVPFPLYRFAGDYQLDVKGVTASGNLQVFAGF
jgi:hypothetical protein